MKIIKVIFLIFILMFPLVLVQAINNYSVELIRYNSDEEESIPIEENESENNNMEEEVVFLNQEDEIIFLNSDKLIRYITCSLYFKIIYIDIKTPPPLF